jgi:hypothetical protein
MMRGQAARALLFVALLSLLAADVSVGCGNAYVYGPVEQKYSSNAQEADSMILVGGQTYLVPQYFYSQLQVGDIVRFNGRAWSIVKKADGTVPAQSAP